MNKGILFTISAPSGAGKTTLIKAMQKVLDQSRRPNNVKVSISYTTRPQRADERQGVDYYFVDRATFQSMIDQDQFLEYATIFGNLYGTSKAWVKSQLAEGFDLILELDWQGAHNLRRLTAMQPSKESRVASASIFILPPTYDALRIRLQSRGQDNDNTIYQRMHNAVEALSHANEYEYLVINDNLEKTVSTIIAIIDSYQQLGEDKNLTIPQVNNDFVEKLITEAMNTQYNERLE